MSVYLYSTQALEAPAARLNPGADGRPFAVVNMGPSYLTFATAAEAYAMRDACQRAGDLLSEAEGTAP